MIVSPDALEWLRPFRETNLRFWSYADPFLDRGMLCFAGYSYSVHEDRLAYHGRHRLTGVTAGEDGSFVTPPFLLPEGGLAIDADTSDGWIEAELLNERGEALEGSPTARVTGTEGQRIPLEPENVPDDLNRCRIRFRMGHSTLYAVLAGD